MTVTATRLTPAQMSVAVCAATGLVVTSGEVDRYLSSGDEAELARFEWSERREIVDCLVFVHELEGTAA